MIATRYGAKQRVATGGAQRNDAQQRAPIARLYRSAKYCKALKTKRRRRELAESDSVSSSRGCSPKARKPRSE